MFKFQISQLFYETNQADFFSGLKVYQFGYNGDVLIS